MDYSSLPTFPPPLLSKFAAPPQGRGWRPTPRQARALIDLAKLAGIVILLVWARQTADALQRPQPASTPPPPPLDFQMVLLNYRRLATEAQVRAVLGTPTRYSGWGGEFV